MQQMILTIEENRPLAPNVYQLRLFGVDPNGKIYKLLRFADEDRDVADPWYTGNFDETYEDVLKGCTALLRMIGKK